MDAAQLVALLVGSGGGGAVLLSLANGLVKRMNGSAIREKDRNADMKSQRDDMYQRLLAAGDAADTESRRRRAAQEHAAELRAMLLERGAPPDTLPKWPSYRSSQLPPQND